MDADIDPSFAADRKSTVDAEQTFVAGASGYFVRYAAFYALHRDIDRTTDRFDRTAFALLFFSGNHSFTISVVGHIGKAMVYPSLS